MCILIVDDILIYFLVALDYHFRELVFENSVHFKNGVLDDI